MNDAAPDEKPNRIHNRIAAVVAMLVVVAVGVSGYVAWRNAITLTHDKLQATLEAEPLDRQAFGDSFGPFTDWTMYTTRDFDSQAYVDGVLHYPDYAGHYHWYEGRGGAGAVRSFFSISSVESPSDRPRINGDFVEMGETRDYCVFMDGNDTIVGWIEVTGGPQLIDVVKWARNHPQTND